MSDTTEIKRLVKKFEEHKDSYKSGKYNEAQLRQEFLDPFFAALGWDIENKDGYAEAYKEVVHEDAIIVGGATKAPDYGFRRGGKRKFFVEAKKPSINIKEDIQPAFQLRSYAWSANLPLSIVTDFEEFAVYDCRIEPNKTDKASIGRIFYFTFDQYEEKWDDIYSIFSKEAIFNGQFDKYAESKKHRGNTEFDDVFLNEMEEWRKNIANNLALRNPTLTQRELNNSVQLTIDRIVFLRICEDRGIEKYGRLRSLNNGANIYMRMVDLFREADDKYNSGLFHFENEKGRPGSPDCLTPTLNIDDKPLKDILKRLYYPESPYIFAVIPADILGQVYERFLGKVIRLTTGHRAKIEEKPEVRKAGGVYYTPTYIVDYIVKNTVGKLVEDKTPKKVEKLRILDPACGSGSFLLGAYQCLLDWHRDWYAKNDPQKHAKGKNPKVYQHGENDWRLTTGEKKRILLNNIYGVDIDTQAVEVTKLSLLLKVLEGESEETLLKQFQLFKERALPDLRANIKCGNSLIGNDFYIGKNRDMYDDDAQMDLNAFDWDGKTGFSEIIRNGGFDAVIGNPPWVFTRDVEFGAEIKKYYKMKYLDRIEKSARTKGNQTGKANLFALFMLRGHSLLNKTGLMGEIVPNTILRTTVYEGIRKYFIESTGIECIVDLKDGVFDNVTASTVILILSNNIRKDEIVIIDNPAKTETINGLTWNLSKKTFASNPSYAFNIYVSNFEDELFGKLYSNSIKLKNLVGVYNGIATYKGKQGISSSRESKFHKKLLTGKDIGRYKYCSNKLYVEYIPEKLQRPRDENIFLAKEKLIMQRIGGILITSYDEGQFYTFNSVNNLITNQDEYSIKYILGFLNSHIQGASATVATSAGVL